MSWFDVAEGRLRLARRLTQAPVREWLASAEGTAAIDAAAQQLRFSLLGRRRSARRQLRRRLRDAIVLPCVREAVAGECDGFLRAWTPLAYAPSLPRLNIAGRRVVVVPRVMIAWRIASRVTARVSESLQSADVPESFKVFFSRWVVARMDDAIQRAHPCPERPLYAEESWACVALDTDLVWTDALFSGRDGQGHVVMCEMPGPRLRRRDRRELEARIEELTESLLSLTRRQRDHTLRVAMDQMASVRA